MLLAAIVAVSNPTCVKLSQDFKENERSYAIFHRLAWRSWETEVAAREAMFPMEMKIAEAEGRLIAAGGTPRPRRSYGPTADEKVAEATKKLREIDAEYKANGDRITTLLIANKCAPPDHVTSSSTFNGEELLRDRPSEMPPIK